MNPAADITEAHAADSILDRRLRINLPAPFLLRLPGRRTVPLWFRRPTCAQVLDMAAMYVRMGVDLKKLDEGEILPLFEEIARHAADCSRIIARGLIRGSLTGFLFVRPLACYLRHHTDMKSLAELAKLVVYLSSGENFASIIRSIAFMRITAPGLSREKTGS
jgi:hypothetical protein